MAGGRAWLALTTTWRPLDHHLTTTSSPQINSVTTWLTTWQPLGNMNINSFGIGKRILRTICCAVFDAYQNPNIFGRQCKWFSVAQELGQIMVLKRGRGRKQDVFPVNASRCHAGPRSKRKKAQGGIRTSDYRPLAPRDDHQAILARTTFVLIASRLDG